MNYAKKLAFTAIVAAALSGCASTQGLTPSAQRTDANQLAAQRTLAQARVSAATWPASDWWRSFGDPQLDRLITEALAGNPTLRVAQARARQALAYADVARAARYPRVDANTSVSRERFSEHGLVPPPYGGSWQTEGQLQATLSYEADLWGKNRAAYESALGLARAADIDTYAARLALSVDIAQAYLQLQRAYEQLDVAQGTLKEREQIYQLTRERFDSGVDTRLALKQAEAALPATREQMAQLEQNKQLAANQLAALIGQGPDRGLTLTRPLIRGLAATAVPTAVPAELVGRRPDIVAQRWRVEAASKAIAVARAQFYPNVNLAAFIGLQSLGLGNLLQAASTAVGGGPAVTLPIFDAGRLRGNLAASDAAYDVAVETYNQTLVSALREVVDQLAALRSLDTQRSEQKRAQATAQEAYDLALLRFREGVGNYLEVLSAESQLLDQQGLDVELRAREIETSIRLTRALGGGYAQTTAAQANAQ